jgi:hypothetical protein
MGGGVQARAWQNPLVVKNVWAQNTKNVWGHSTGLPGAHVPYLLPLTSSIIMISILK